MGFCLRVMPIMTVVLIICQLSLAGENQTVLLDADTQYAFAERLYNHGDYTLAINEYHRFIFLFPEHTGVETAMYKIGMSFFKSGRYQESITAFKAQINQFPGGEHADPSYFQISEAYVNINQGGAAIANLRNLITLTEDPRIKDQAYYRMGWIYIGMSRLPQARETFEKISPQSRDRYRLQALSDALADEEGMKRKSPGVAGTLAILPGAGYLYCGRYQDALMALVVNGGLIWAAYESFSNELYALGSVITFVEIGFYAGNIYGSMASAHKYNRRQERRWIENLRQNLRVGLSARKETKGLELSLKYNF